MPTETEAKSNWCPFARTFDSWDGSKCSINRNDDGSLVTSCRCIASKCMAWRWRDARAGHSARYAQYASGAVPLEAEPERPKEVPLTWSWDPGAPIGMGSVYRSPRWVEPEEEAKARFVLERHGFCGLAGPIV